MWILNSKRSDQSESSSASTLSENSNLYDLVSYYLTSLTNIEEQIIEELV